MVARWAGRGRWSWRRVAVHNADMPDTLSTLLLPELYLAETAAGWRYRAPAPGEYANWQPLDAHPTRGPFATPEEAARDAVATLGLTQQALSLLPDFPPGDTRWEGMRRAVEALRDAVTTATQ